MSEYLHWGKPYRKVGTFQKEVLEEVKNLFRSLSEGIPGIGAFGTSGSNIMKDGGLGCDLRLFALRMDHNKEAQRIVSEFAEKHNIPWLAEELLKNEQPEDTHFIISPDAELHAVQW